MRIVFTARGKGWDASMDPRLGRTEFLVLYDEERDEMRSISNEESLTMQHAGPHIAQKIMELAPDVIITGNGPGRRAYEMLERSDIAIYVGAGEMSIQEAYDAYKANRLERFQEGYHEKG